MPDWRMSGPYFKSCNCEPGCPCDFMSPPTYHECEGVIGMNKGMRLGLCRFPIIRDASNRRALSTPVGE